jgi:hypothetical protein
MGRSRTADGTIRARGACDGVDHDGDGILERLVKFDRAAVIALLPPGTNPVRVTGELADGTAFAGWSDPVRVLGTP